MQTLTATGFGTRELSMAELDLVSGGWNWNKVDWGKAAALRWRRSIRGRNSRRRWRPCWRRIWCCRWIYSRIRRLSYQRCLVKLHISYRRIARRLCLKQGRLAIPSSQLYIMRKPL